MKCDSQASLLACIVANPYFGHKLKARVAIIIVHVWVVYKGRHYAALWSMFPKMAYGMFHTTIGGETNWEMVLS